MRAILPTALLLFCPAAFAAPRAVPARIAPGPVSIWSLRQAAAAVPLPTRALRRDQIVLRGWQLALHSKSRRARFGAQVIDRGGNVIGEGWNRRSTKAERRLIRVGLIIHAEQVALAQAWRRTGDDLEGASVYAVGISKDGLSYAQKRRPVFACKTCARTLERFQVDAMSSSSRGFRRIPWDRLRSMVAENGHRRWWQHAETGAGADPNIRWRPVSGLLARLRPAR